MATFRTDDDVEIFYQDRGEGPALVLLHSFGTSGAVFDLQVLGLADNYRLIVPDLRGCGQSGQPISGNTVARNALDVLNLLEHLAVTRAAVLGSSLGGNIALRCALDAPDRITGVITVGCPFDALEGQPDHPVFTGFAQSVRAGRPAALAGMAARQLGPLGDEHLRLWLGGLLLQSGPFTEEIMFDLAAEPLKARLPGLRLPVEIFQGALDTSVPLAVGQSANERLATAWVTVFEDCAHLPHLENPVAFNSRLEEALARICRGSEGSQPEPPT